jgi:serine/threonine protein phosphatase PrpC
MGIWDYFVLSFVGRRAINQDSCIALELPNSAYLFAIADGMGGMEGGEIASKIVLDVISQTILHYLTSQTEKDVDLKDCLTLAINNANNAIIQRIKEQPMLKGMGTTITALLVKDNKYVWGNVGDSRIYRLKDDDLTQITKDHTYIQEFIDKNVSMTDSSFIQKYSNLLIHALNGESFTVDIFPKNEDFCELNFNEVFLLCSDGLIINKANTNTNLFKNYILGVR